MDVAPAINLGTTTTSPPAAPSRPAIPPKPAKDRISMMGSKGNTGTQAGLPRRCSSADPTTAATTCHGHPHPVRSPQSPEANNRGNAHQSVSHFLPKSSSAVLSSPPPHPPPILGGNINQISPGSKPALPPKPVSHNLSSPPLANKPKLPPLPQHHPVDNATFLNENSAHGDNNIGLVHSRPPVLRTKPPSKNPLSPRFIPQHPNSRPSSGTCFNFSSPIQNLNSANFPSTSNGLNQSGIGATTSPPTRLAGIRMKSASLGRNVSFPSSTEGGGIRGALSRFLPSLDLHIGSGNRNIAPTNINNKPRPNALNLNPFIQQNQQGQMSQKQTHSQALPIRNFGKSIAFSPESELPPPPPPRLKKKLSPVNSLNLGSPSSPTSPNSIIFSSLAPNNSPLPVPPSTSPTNFGSPTENGTAIYAEIDMEKKWAERKLKAEVTKSNESNLETTSSIKNRIELLNKPDSSQNGNMETITDLRQRIASYEDLHEPHNGESISNSGDNNNKNDDTLKEPKATVVDSWLGKYLNNTPSNRNVTSENIGNPPQENETLRSGTPTYQSAKTGHIYETIGECENKDGESNNNNNQNKCLKSEHEDEDNLGENQSFLFKLIIGQKKPVLTVESNSGDLLTEKQESCVENSESAENKISEMGFDLVDNQEKSVPINEKQNIALNDVPPPPPLRLFQRNSLKIAEELTSSTKCLKSTSVIQDTKVSPPEEFISEKDINNTPLLEAINEHLSILSVESTNISTPQSATPSRNSSILRRRSWNCDNRVDSPSLSDSSSVASSTSYLSYQHKRDTSDRGNRDSLLSREDWVDEGDLSNGVLADAESSDVNHPSSAEDISNIRTSGISSSSSSITKGFGARRSRLVNSLFGSFGKASSSSSGGCDDGAGPGKRLSALRSSGGSGGKGKYSNKERSSIFYTPPNTSASSQKTSHQNSAISQWGRQVSDSALSTTMISGPILPASASLDNETLHQKSNSVQFSSEVSETRIIYHERDSSEDGKKSSSKNLSTSLISSPQTDRDSAIVHLPQSSINESQSLSSSESTSEGSVSGSISGFEDILATLSPKETSSFYVAREILTTERTFVDVLNLLTVDFPKTLSTASRFQGAYVISEKDLGIILGGLPTLKKVNEDLLEGLEDRLRNWKEKPKIADILVKKGPFLKLYATYIKDFSKNCEYLDECCKQFPLFASTVRDFEASDRCKKLNLHTYLLTPIQRIAKYPLLLADYKKTLNEDSEDYADTVKGIAIVKEVAAHANEAINLQMNADKLLHLQNRLSVVTVILKSDRQLIKQGELNKVCRKELQPRFLALMNDCLFCFTYQAAAGSPKDLKLRYELPLAGMRVSLSPTEDYRNEFSVISVTRSFNLVAKSTKERDEWMKALNDAINDNLKKRTCSTPDEEMGLQIGKEAPVWIQDSRVTRCQQCTAEFTITFRRHHCRACGKVVCGNCSGNKAPLLYLENASHRVCDSCYEYLLDEFDKLSGLAINDSDSNRGSIREKFKKETPNVSKRATKIKRTVPSRLEVHANSSGSKINGYLQWRPKEKKSWKRKWFVLIDRVLYVYAASEDIVAIKSVPLLGWAVESDSSEKPDNNDENLVVFKLTHKNQQPILFQTDNLTTAEKWMSAMKEATVYK